MHVQYDRELSAWVTPCVRQRKFEESVTQNSSHSYLNVLLRNADLPNDAPQMLGSRQRTNVQQVIVYSYSHVTRNSRSTLHKKLTWCAALISLH